MWRRAGTAESSSSRPTRLGEKPLRITHQKSQADEAPAVQGNQEHGRNADDGPTPTGNIEILRECRCLANLDETCFRDIPEARSTTFTGLAVISGRKRFLLSYFFFLVL